MGRFPIMIYRIRSITLLILIVAVSLMSCSIENYTNTFTARGSIYGKVIVEGNLSNSGVLITAKSTNGNYSYSAYSDYDGQFLITDMQPSTYTVTYSKTGYSEESRPVTVVSDRSFDMGTVTLSFGNSGPGDNGGSEGNEDTPPGDPCSVKWAGIRISTYGMRNSFGKDNFPNETSMAVYAKKMASCYTGSKGIYILIVGELHSDGCRLYFPVNEEYDHVSGTDTDKYESYLAKCDKLGIDVWLQVEPGYANLVTLADLVMKQYGHHSCVKGFGIDVEWHKPVEGSDEGTKLSDSDAQAVLSKIREYNSEYTLFVKHWMQKQLPSKMDGLIYVNDSQQFDSMDHVLRVTFFICAL